MDRYWTICCEQVFAKVLYQAECATGFWTYRFFGYFILRSDCHAPRLQNPRRVSISYIVSTAIIDVIV